MDAIVEFALSALDNAVAEMLPDSTPPELQRQVRIFPVETRATGLGGHLGTNADPRGSTVGRQIVARLDVSIRGGDDDAAADYLNRVVRSFLSQDRTDLRRRGIQRLELLPDGLEPRSARFDLFFDYRHLPSEAQGLIESLDVVLDTNFTPYQARYLWDLATRTLAGTTQPLADFQVADDPDRSPSSPPSQWEFNAAQSCIAQIAGTGGGPLDLSDPKKAGTHLLWRPAGRPFELGRFMAGIEFESGSEDGLGLVFGREDDDNFWYFLASQRHRYHLFGRKANGIYSFVGAPANEVGFALNRRHGLKLTVHDQTLTAELDGGRTLEVKSEDAVKAGELGFFTHGNDQARFYRVCLLELV